MSGSGGCTFFSSLDGSDALKSELEGILFVLDARFGLGGIGLLTKLATNGRQLLEENFLGVHSALGVHMAHHFATLLKVELTPVLHIHAKDVSLGKMNFGGRQQL